MDWIGPLFNGLTAFLLNAPVAATLSAVGFVLLALAGALIYFAISNGAGLTTSMRVLLFCCLIGGILFSAAGPGFAVIRGAPAVIEQITKQSSCDSMNACMIMVHHSAIHLLSHAYRFSLCTHLLFNIDCNRNCFVRN